MMGYGSTDFASTHFYSVDQFQQGWVGVGVGEGGGREGEGESVDLFLFDF